MSTLQKPSINRGRVTHSRRKDRQILDSLVLPCDHYLQAPDMANCARRFSMKMLILNMYHIFDSVADGAKPKQRNNLRAFPNTSSAVDQTSAAAKHKSNAGIKTTCPSARTTFPPNIWGFSSSREMLSWLRNSKMLRGFYWQRFVLDGGLSATRSGGSAIMFSNHSNSIFFHRLRLLASIGLLMSIRR